VELCGAPVGSVTGFGGGADSWAYSRTAPSDKVAVSAVAYAVSRKP